MNFTEILQILLFGYEVPPEMIDPNYPACLQRIGGLMLTLVITGFSILIGTPLGLLLALMRDLIRKKSKHDPAVWHYPASWFATGCIEIVKGLPVMILVLLFFYLPYRLFSLRLPPIVLAVLAFSVYCGGYMSEAFQSGFRAVRREWLDQGLTLGMTKLQILLRIRLPIVFRAMLPTFLGLVITVFKDTSVLVVVAVPELTFSGRSVQAAEPANYAVVLAVIMLLYWGIASSGAGITHLLARRISAKLNV